MPALRKLSGQISIVEIEDAAAGSIQRRRKDREAGQSSFHLMEGKIDEAWTNGSIISE